MTEKKDKNIIDYLHSPSFGSLLESSLRRLMYYVGLHVEIHKLTNMTHIRISRFGGPARLDLILQVKHEKITGIRSSDQLILYANKCSQFLISVVTFQQSDICHEVLARKKTIFMLSPGLW